MLGMLFSRRSHLRHSARQRSRMVLDLRGVERLESRVVLSFGANYNAAAEVLTTRCADLPEGAKIEAELSGAVNELGIGPQGLGGRSTSFAVHVEIAATHITQNPVAVNIQCHSARRARATITPGGIAFSA